MKKVIVLFTLVMTIMGGVFTYISIKNYDDTKEKKNVDKLLSNVEKEKLEKKKEIEIKQEELNKIKEDSKEKVEELELWEEKLKGMENNLY